MPLRLYQVFKVRASVVSEYYLPRGLSSYLHSACRINSGAVDTAKSEQRQQRKGAITALPNELEPCLRNVRNLSANHEGR